MSKRKFRLGLIWTLVLGLLPAAVWAAGPPPPSPAPPSAPVPHGAKAAVGLDVVLLIDQSGSMGGSKSHPGQSDPHAKRISAVELVAHLLSAATESHYLAYGARVSHQVGVVEFGTNARVALPGAVVEFDPQLSQSARDVQLNHILSSVRANELGNTNHLHAFELAEGLLQQMRQKNLPGPRRQLVLMVTDGQSYLDGVNIHSYQVKMQQYLRKHFLNRGIAIEVVGLDAAELYWIKNKTGEYWQQTTDGHARRIENPDDFYEALKTIVLQYVTLAGKLVSVEENYDCPPYLSHFIVIVDKIMPGADIAIHDPGGQVVDLMALPHTRRNNYSRYTIARPMPGMWRFNQPQGAGSCRVEVQQFYTRVMFVEPQAPLGLQQATPIRFQVSSLQGTPFQEDPRFPVTMSVGVTSPGGKDLGAIPAKHDGKGGVVTTQPLVPTEYGDYRVRLEGVTRSVGGKIVEVFTSPEVVIKVLNKNPLAIRLLNPEPDGSVSLTWGRGAVEVAAVVALKDQPQKPLDLGQVSRAPGRLLEAELLDRQGGRVAGPVWLTPAQGQLQGELKVEVPLFSWRWLTLWTSKYWLRLVQH
ncbi:MAG: vWA domain-containing protein, partial [Pseudomonadota bacterium]